ncbi:hybrid sensor histidine kinase/response regulator [Paracoccus gahaiensis]|uniref:hybrid sensor histidine kinase/response regulator n=1 Tax=Paracoccus gahaiensis TaxID=1706839 RepID=UPI00145F4012|nr:ATP-binding protein [Paracoccus gahaiensis]
MPALFALAVAVLSVVVWNHHRDIHLQIDRLAIANSDSTQWFLAQLEVEAMAAERAVLAFRDSETTDTQLADIRKRFDILYSRVHTLRTGRTFAALRNQSSVHDALEDLQARLDAVVPVIDGSSAHLSAARDALSHELEAALPLVRQISLAGVRQFAKQSDEQRQAVVRTLFQLSLLLVPLIFILIATTAVLFVMFRAAGVQTAQISAAGEQMRSLFDASTDAILFARPDGRVRGYNKAAERLFGYEPEEAIDADLVELLMPFPQREAVRALLAEVQLGRPRGDASASAAVTATAQHKSGRIIPVEMSWSIASDSQGRLLVAYVRDVSQRAQEEAELIEARDRAVSGETAKSRLIAVMSHEMRTPLNGLLGTLDLLKLTELDMRQHRYLNAMEKSGRMLLRHVNDVLDASRAGGSSLTETLDLAALVQSTVEGLKAHAEQRGNQLEVAVIGDHDELLIGSPLQIEQILINLVGNAIKFTRDGVIRIELDRSAGAEEIELRVSDTGIGIAPDDLDRIFDDFITLDTTFDRAEGTGLGLSIVRTLVGTLNGQVDVESVLGEGTIFSVNFCLPLADPLERPVAPVKGVPSAYRLRVLVVDDNEINRFVVSDMLRHLDCDVVEAPDGLAACEIAETLPMDLILMDISMPRLNGVGAARRIRTAGANRQTRIVAVTAHALPEDIAGFRAAGMEHVLVKPLQLRDLSDLLEAMTGAPRQDAAQRPPLPSQILRRIDEELQIELLDLDLHQADLAARVHRVAGTAALGGYSTLHGTLSQLEVALRQDAAAADLSQLLQEVGTLVKGLQTASQYSAA